MECPRPAEYLPSEGAIIPLHLVPEVELPKDQEPIPVTITGPTELVQDERSIDIKSQVFAYNALLLCRDRHVSSGELRSFSFLSVSGPTLWEQLEVLSQKLCDLTGEEIILKEGGGRWRTYMLSPRLQVTDEREDINSSLKRKLQQLATSYPASLADFDPTKPVTFKNNPTRQRALAMVIRDYSILPEVRRAIKSFQTVPGFTLARERWSGYQKQSQEECVRLFTQIEYGLAAATVQEDAEFDIQAATEMVVAYHQLYFGHLFLVRTLADEMCRTAQEHSYLFEVGSADLLKAIMNYKVRPDESEGGTFASLAYETIKQGMQHYKTFENERPYNVPKSLVENRKLVVKAIDDYIARHRRMPANKEVAHELELTTDQVKTALGLSFDGEDVANFEDSALTEDTDRFENDLRSYMAEIEIHDMFYETEHPDSLTDREKVVLSLRYAIFVPCLAGTEIRVKGSVAFTYPHSVESLPQFAPAHAQIATMLGSSEMTINRAEKSALRKARHILLDRGVVAPETD